MSELIKTSIKKNKRQYQPRIIMKNGIKYIIAITTNKKHKTRKFKQFKTKKREIKDVLYLGRVITNKAEIEEIIAKKADEQKAYDKLFLQEINELYCIHLTEKQYNVFALFVEKNKIKLNDIFSFERIGKGLKTNIVFTMSKNSIKKPAKK